MNLKDTTIGIEFGSTVIKAVLLSKDHKILAQGKYAWENKLEKGIWTYDLEQAKVGLRSCFIALKDDVKQKYDVILNMTGALGISGMMHGYLPFDRNGNQLTAFRTWRNTITEKASKELSELFDFNIPQRWSIAHLYEAILNKEDHINKIDYLTTLASYFHYLLTGKKVIGINEASGMFPIDYKTNDYHKEMVDKFYDLTNINVLNILPKIKLAGENAGYLTKEGALLLDPSGEFEAGIPLVAPEGDAGTGMVATNSVKEGFGNVSAGTSIFSMFVLDKEIKHHKEIDIVATPSGKPVAMVHCNNCSGDINAWVNIINEALELFDVKVDTNTLYTKLFEASLNAADDVNGLVSFNYYSGEEITDLDQGRLLFIRKPNARFNLSNFMKTNIYSSLATLRLGMDILDQENIKIDKVYAHGGLFKTKEVAQRILSASLKTPVSVMAEAGEGGPYGMALLAAYYLWKDDKESLEDYLDKKVFKDVEVLTIMANEKEINGFNKYVSDYQKCLSIEKEAVKSFD